MSSYFGVNEGITILSEKSRLVLPKCHLGPKERSKVSRISGRKTVNRIRDLLHIRFSQKGHNITPQIHIRKELLRLALVDMDQ